jgi:hypothetical protein
MADWVTISSLATAGGTLVLAVATFSSVRSANRSARIAEQSLLVGLRPILIPSREDDPAERARFGDGYAMTVPGHGGAAEVTESAIYLAMGLRNGGQGLAVIHGWQVYGDSTRTAATERPDPAGFRRQGLDLFIPPGATGYWEGALREPQEDRFAEIAQALRDGERILVDLLYGDHEGGQRAIARFSLHVDPEAEGRRVQSIRYWNVDRSDPRDRG